MNAVVHTPAAPAARLAATLPAMRLVQTPRVARRLASWLLVLLTISIAAMAWLPWQQNSRGEGRVVAYHPTERPQTVESPIYGNVVRWGEGIVEGARVKKGQLIVEIQANDALFADRLTLMVDAAADKVRFSEQKVKLYQQQEQDLAAARRMVIESGQALIAEAERKLQAERESVSEIEAGLAQKESNFLRQKKLFEAGIRAGVEFEKDKAAYEEALAKKRKADEYVKAAESYRASKLADLEQKAREAQTKVDYAKALQQETSGEIALARKELAEIQSKQAVFERRKVVAPRDGIILRLYANNEAEQLKEGAPLFTIVPETTDRAVELFVNGNDIPLVRVGREVRLQFEGWPAIQFAAGWPHAAFGTFGGEVAAMDATDEKGKFRILVRPLANEPWPDEKFLRQGTRANGWVLLSQVKLGYEIWRQLNGFPAVYDDGSSDKAGGEKESKKIKLPK